MSLGARAEPPAATAPADNARMNNRALHCPSRHRRAARRERSATGRAGELAGRLVGTNLGYECWHGFCLKRQAVDACPVPVHFRRRPQVFHRLSTAYAQLINSPVIASGCLRTRSERSRPLWYSRAADRRSGDPLRFPFSLPAERSAPALPAPLTSSPATGSPVEACAFERVLLTHRVRARAARNVRVECA